MDSLEKNRRKEDQRPAQQLDWSGSDPAHVEALAEAMLRAVYQRPDLTQMAREQFISDLMANREELTVGGGDFRNMARTALAGIDEQLYGLIDRLGDRLVMMVKYLSDADRAKFETEWNDHLRTVRFSQHSDQAKTLARDDTAERACVMEWANETQQRGPSQDDVWAIYQHGKETARYEARVAAVLATTKAYGAEAAFGDVALYGIGAYKVHADGSTEQVKPEAMFKTSDQLDAELAAARAEVGHADMITIFCIALVGETTTGSLWFRSRAERDASKGENAAEREVTFMLDVPKGASDDEITKLVDAAETHETYTPELNEAKLANRAAAEKVAFIAPPGVRDALYPAYVIPQNYGKSE